MNRDEFSMNLITNVHLSSPVLCGLPVKAYGSKFYSE